VTRLLLLVALGCAVLAACDGGEGEERPSIPGAATLIDDPFSGGYPTYEHEPTGLRIVFGTPDLGVGPSRVSFALFDDDGIVSFPTLNVTTRSYPDGGDASAVPGREVTLDFRPFPEGGRGIYTGTVDFDSAGLWSIDAAVPQPDGSFARVLFPVEVAEHSTAPAVGDPAPASEHRTVADAYFDELTTSSTPDPSLYNVEIPQALEAGRPFVVTFASPAFCTNALCGPQVEVLSELGATYRERMDFIHVDLYENPHEIRGDLSVARRAPALEEWGLHTDEWTFVVNADGLVAARFEGFAPIEEVEAAVQAVLLDP